ncbi:MAG: hypothetical protein WBA42_13230 [Mesorhizobium sp.]
MSEGRIDEAITDHTAAVLLRYFGAAGAASVTRPSFVIDRDRELLRLHWSLSPSVMDLVDYILIHRHEIQSVLTTARRVEDGIVRGRLDAVATLRMRRVSGHSTAIVSHEPLRSYESGPNHLLGWVIMQAWSLASRFVALAQEDSSYRARIDFTVQRLEQVRRVETIRQIGGQVSLSGRPRANALLEAERSRRKVYHKAAKAFRALLLVEAGDPDAVTSMLKETLLAPLEPWRRYELAVAYSVAEALANVQDEQVRLGFIVGDVRIAIAQAGQFNIYWQWRTERYKAPVQEPSEEMAEAIWAAYGLSAAADRPDLIVTDMQTGAVIAIIEVKYLTGESAADRIRSAANQLVRYARGYGAIDEIGPLLGRSLIAVSQGIGGLKTPAFATSGIPTIVDFAGIGAKALLPWARRLLPDSSPSAL